MASLFDDGFTHFEWVTHRCHLKTMKKFHQRLQSCLRKILFILWEDRRNFAYSIIMVSESKRFFFLNLYHLYDGISRTMCEVTVVVTLVESTVNIRLPNCCSPVMLQNCVYFVPFSRLAGECESSIIQQSMLLQCLPVVSVLW